MEKQRNNLISSINSDKQQLQQLEDKILRLLYTSEGNILDDEELVETLNESKETAMVIASHLFDSEKTEETITIEREKYRSLAVKGAVLFFVVSSLAEIDPMYQFSLRYFSQIFCNVIEEEAPKMGFQDRLKYLHQQSLRAIYANICRGLFEKHKIIYSFLIAIEIEKLNGHVKDDEVDFLLHGAVQIDNDPSNKPAVIPTNMTDKQWNQCNFLQNRFENFKELTIDLDKTINISLKDKIFNVTEGSKEATVEWSTKLNSFQKLMLISVLKPENLMMAISHYILETLGRDFIEAKPTSIASVYQDMKNTIPLIFVLSSGSDPLGSLQKFANEKECSEKFHSISLGQGQGTAAQSLITKGRTAGHWVYLQNCHLATSWMTTLETIVHDIMLGNLQAHLDFRLFLSAMPVKSFPVSTLQNSIKLTNEPPKGLKSNLMRALIDLNEETFEFHILGHTWRKMIFGLCMFHGVVLERKKFGSLGFNILYEFSNEDREAAFRTLNLFINREVRTEIPWQALEYINAEITYGGRVTDEWDQRCIRTILKTFSNEKILEDGYTYSQSGIYQCPESQKLADFREYVSQLPYKEEPEIFGMHENANIVYETKEANFFLRTIVESQTKNISSAGNDNDELALEMVQKIKTVLFKSITLENMKPELLSKDANDRVHPLTTVVMQEAERFNKLLKIVRNNLKDLEKGIKGLIVMSENLEKVYASFLINQVPAVWSENGFLSTKSLASWVEDFCIRIEHIQVNITYLMIV